MAEKENVLQLVRMKGPVLPSQISKDIGTNILFASAILSELVDKRELKLSHVKVGGSPVYYVSGQEQRLQQFANKLHEKERKAFELLRQQQILRDAQQEPVMRAALRQIKDFAKPLEVNFNGTTEIFWKWYLLSNAEAESQIKRQLGVLQQTSVQKPAVQVPTPKRVQEERKLPEQKATPFVDTAEPKDRFYKKIKYFFDKHQIKILQHKVIRKNADIELLVEIPSPVGKLTYFCKAKSKKRINDGDLSSVFIQGQGKKLPVLLLVTGEMTKKADQLLQAEFKNMQVKKL